MNNHEIVKTEDVLVRTMELASGAATDWHHHTEVTDFFVCLTGVVQIETMDSESMIVLHPGQRTEVKPSHIHRVINAQGDTSEYLLIQGVGKYDFIKE